MKKIKQCADNRYCRVRAFVQIAGVLLLVAIIAIILWEKGAISV
jgi:hypothetical protein